jgi:hypothetical protein
MHFVIRRNAIDMYVRPTLCAKFGNTQNVRLGWRNDVTSGRVGVRQKSGGRPGSPGHSRDAFGVFSGGNGSGTDLRMHGGDLVQTGADWANV